MYCLGRSTVLVVAWVSWFYFRMGCTSEGSDSGMSVPTCLFATADTFARRYPTPDWK